jgi:hypothetical protein
MSVVRHIRQPTFVTDPDPPPITPAFFPEPQLPHSQTPYFVIDVYSRPEEKVVRVWHQPGFADRFIRLSGRWVVSSLSYLNPLFVIGDWVCGSDPQGLYTDRLSMRIDDESGFLVLFPHATVAARRLSDCVYCLRRGYLTYIMPEGVGDPMTIYGTVAHGVVQQVLSGLLPERVNDAVRHLASSQLSRMAAVGLDSGALVAQMAPVAELAKSLNITDLTKPPYG